MTEVRAEDSHTVFIKLKEAHTRAHYSFLIGLWVPPIVPEHVWSKEDPTTFKNWPDPVWTGPYKLVEYKRRGGLLGAPRRLLGQGRDGTSSRAPSSCWSPGRARPRR